MNRTGTFYTAETLAKYGINAELLVGDGASPEEFEAIAGIRLIGPGQKSSQDILLTHLRSPNRHAEHGPGRRDSAAFEFTGIWMPTEQSQSMAGGGSGAFAEGGLFKLEQTQEVRNFLIRLYPNTLTEATYIGSPAAPPEGVFEWPFRGYLASLQPGQIVDNNIVEITGSIQPTGDYSALLP